MASSVDSPCLCTLRLNSATYPRRSLSIRQIPVTYPTTAPEIALPELDGKTAKMFRGGKICISDHFKPLWARNVPKFGIAHAMALGVSKRIAKPVHSNLFSIVPKLTENFPPLLPKARTLAGGRNTRSDRKELDKAQGRAGVKELNCKQGNRFIHRNSIPEIHLFEQVEGARKIKNSNKFNNYG